MDNLSGFIISLTNELEEKKKNPFKQILMINEEPEHDILTNLDRVNKLIEQHNIRTQKFLETVETYSEIIEESFVAEKLDEYLELNAEITEYQKNIENLRSSLNENEKKIVQLETEIILHRPSR